MFDILRGIVLQVERDHQPVDATDVLLVPFLSAPADKFLLNILSLRFQNGGRSGEYDFDLEGVPWKKGTSSREKVDYYRGRGYSKKRIARILKVSLRTVQRYTQESKLEKKQKNNSNFSLRAWLHPRDLGLPRNQEKDQKGNKEEK